MSALYGEVIAEHARAPRNFGPLPAPDAAHEDVNPLCGDRIRIELRLARGRIAEARFGGEACMVATAAASLLTGLVVGQSLEEAAALPREALLAALQATLRPSRVACATLPLAVLQGAIAHRPPAAP
ncbi:MAG: SUF system NifU family Fe-S cluster assembly protein [Myxococcales bacterium]